MAEGAIFQPSVQSPSPSATVTPPVPSHDLPQNPQPRTVGGFVLDDEEIEETGTNTSANLSNVHDQKNSFDGAPTIPQQIAPPMHVPSLSRTQSSLDLSAVSNNVEKQIASDNVPSHSSDAHVTFQGPSDVPPSSNSPSPIRPSSQNTPLNPTHESRPATANGVTHSPIATLANTRLPYDRVGILEDRIAEDPRGDIEAWLDLIDNHKRRNKAQEVRQTYDRFLNIFPATADQWNAYANWELQNNNLFQAEQILRKCVKELPSLALWTTYLNYVRRRLPTMSNEGEQNRKTISQTFDVVMKNVGIDKDAGSIWLDHINFLKTMPGTLGGSSWQDQQKMDILRKTYQRAISIPTDAVTKLWKEYDAFEMGLDKAAARKYLLEKGEEYMTARSASIKLQNMTAGLSRSTLPILPPTKDTEGEEEYMKQVRIWNEWIAWEKDDPLVLQPDQASEFRDRVLYVYKQATMSLRLWPNVWYDASEWCFENGLEEEGKRFLEQGVTANPESCLLAFKLGDYLESTVKSEEGEEGLKHRGDIVRAPYDNALNALYDLITKTEERENRAIAQVRERFAQRKSYSPLLEQSGDQEEDQEEGNSESESRLQAQIDIISRTAKAHNDLNRTLISSVWIALMRAMRRVQGKGKVGATVGGFRQIFIDARKRGKITSEVYTASALLEHYCYKDETALKVFERGLKLFPEDENFATEYIKHLISINDSTNARAVFESVVSKLTAKEETKPRAKSIFLLFHQHEALYGELEQTKKLEKRISTLYPEDPQLKLFARRYTIPKFDPCLVRPVISATAQAQTKSNFAMNGTKNLSPSLPNSPLRSFAANSSGRNSPKRALDTSDNEMPARKIQRVESPLRGAAGRRLDAARRTALRNEVNPGMTTPQPGPPAPLPAAIVELLGMIPPAHTWLAPHPDPQKMLQLLRDMDFSRANLHQTGSS